MSYFISLFLFLSFSLYITIIAHCVVEIDISMLEVYIQYAVILSNIFIVKAFKQSEKMQEIWIGDNLSVHLIHISSNMIILLLRTESTIELLIHLQITPSTKLWWQLIKTLECELSLNFFNPSSFFFLWTKHIF